MKSNFFSKLSVMLVVFEFISAGTLVNAQTLKMKSSTFTISGTTNVHPYKSKSTQASGQMTVSGTSVTALTVEVPVKSIVSGEKLMDKKTYETFNEPKNPTITFKMTDVKSVTVNGDNINATVAGTLSMGGATKSVTLKVKGKEVKPGTYTFEGSLPVKMSDYKMKAPTAMLGAMKVGDGVTVDFKATFEGPAVKFN